MRSLGLKQEDKFYDKPELVAAAEAGDTKRALQLLKSGDDPNLPFPNGCTALMYAAHDGNVTLCEALIKAEAKIDQATPSGSTALTYAVLEPNRQTFWYLMRHGANVRSKGGMEALPWASENADFPAIKVLVLAGVPVDTVDYLGTTPLIIAAEKRRSDIARFLISRGANINHKSRQYWTPLLMAAQMGDSVMVYELVRRGANVNADWGLGITPLTWAIEAKEVRSVTILLHNKAKVTTKHLTAAQKTGEQTLIQIISNALKRQQRSKPE